MATAIKERGIIFSAPMIRKILDGTKTQTRRVVKPQPIRTISDWSTGVEPGDAVMYFGWPTVLRESRGRNKRDAGILSPQSILCPYGKPGDRLWVRETWWPAFKRTANSTGSRITLEVTAVRVERVQDISDEDALAEGTAAVTGCACGHKGEKIAYCAACGKSCFWSLWDTINGKKYPWASNPWVFVIGFKRVEGR